MTNALPSTRDTREMHILVLPPTRADGNAIQKLLDAAEIDCRQVSSVAELCRGMRAGAAAAMLSEEAAVADTAPLLAELARQPVWSDFPLLILSRSGRESSALVQLLSQLGNVSVIERPVRTSTLLSLIRSSQRTRSRQYDLRQHLADRQAADGEREQLLDSERTARGEAERASRMKDEFLATLSHELRTPLHAILGWAQVLRRNSGISQDVAKGLDTIERNARSQARIIEDLLDMSSIISGKVRLDVQWVDLASIIIATTETVRPAAQAKGVLLQTVLDPSAGLIRGDPNRLQQILWNLLTNAVKFTPRNGRVVTTLSCGDSYLEIEVEDTGEGIDPTFLPHVFDRFRQADASTDRGHGGLGLGLSIVKQLAELHGGTVAADSAGRGSGSSFRLAFPVLPVGDASEQEEAHLHPSRPNSNPEGAKVFDAARASLAGLSVLVVDDELDSRTLVQRLLEERGARVTLAGCTSEALAAIGHRVPDVLVSDIGMAGQDGYALIRQVRALRGSSAHIPAIALTAYASAADRAKAMRAGYQSHLSKPIEPNELVEAICSLRSAAAAVTEGREALVKRYTGQGEDVA
jgi:signal transduction histidine kinase/ActR/RegA family two-component response regulator